MPLQQLKREKLIGLRLKGLLFGHRKRPLHRQDEFARQGGILERSGEALGVADNVGRPFRVTVKNNACARRAIDQHSRSDVEMHLFVLNGDASLLLRNAAPAVPAVVPFPRQALHHEVKDRIRVLGPLHVLEFEHQVDVELIVVQPRRDRRLDSERPLRIEKKRAVGTQRAAIRFQEFGDSLIVCNRLSVPARRKLNLLGNVAKEFVKPSSRTVHDGSVVALGCATHAGKGCRVPRAQRGHLEQRCFDRPYETLTGCFQVSTKISRFFGGTGLPVPLVRARGAPRHDRLAARCPARFRLAPRSRLHRLAARAGSRPKPWLSTWVTRQASPWQRIDVAIGHLPPGDGVCERSMKTSLPSGSTARRAHPFPRFGNAVKGPTWLRTGTPSHSRHKAVQRVVSTNNSWAASAPAAILSK